MGYKGTPKLQILRKRKKIAYKWGYYVETKEKCLETVQKTHLQANKIATNMTLNINAPVSENELIEWTAHTFEKRAPGLVRRPGNDCLLSRLPWNPASEFHISAYAISQQELSKQRQRVNTGNIARQHAQSAVGLNQTYRWSDQ